MLIGYLIFRSTFLPQIMGAFLAIAGLCYLVNYLANFPALPLADYSLRYVALPGGFVGEGSLILWLFVMGVNTERWKKRSNSAANGHDSD